MITSATWAGKRYAVLGLARSGAATVRALVASGAEVVAWDDNHATWKDVLVPIKEDRHTGRTPEPNVRIKNWPLALDLTGFEAVVVSPGVPLNKHPVAEKARRYGLPIIGDIELFAQARGELPPHKVVGITGTNGKSTTTALIHHILQTAGVPSLMGGNIGLPILGQEPLPAGGVYVLELSSYQLDLTRSLDCDVAVLTNITPDHLDRYDGFEAYAASKARLFAMQSEQHVAVCTDDPASAKVWRGLAERDDDPSVTATTTPYGDYSVHDGLAVARGFGRIGLQKNWPALQGPHNAQNAACAMAVCVALGLDGAAISAGLRTFPGLPHRMQRVAEKGGVLYVNDSKATNATAAAPALAAFPAIHWILGGRAKTDELDECAPHFDHVRAGYTIGEAGPLFARILRAADKPVTESGTLDRAVRDAAAAARPGETVLLSPACASFDQFRDFEARGDAFAAAVEALP